MIARCRVTAVNKNLSNLKTGDHVYAQRSDYKTNEIDDPTLRVTAISNGVITTRDAVLTGRMQQWDAVTGQDLARPSWRIVEVTAW